MSVVEVSELRAANVDRERVVEQLNRAHAEGRLDLLELDERLAAAYAARTYGELEPLTADLPAGGAGGCDRTASAGGDTASGRAAGFGAVRSPWERRLGSGWSHWYALALRIEGAAWLFASVLNLGIWAAVSLGTAESVYPWWIWVAGPWGSVLLARMLGEVMRARLRGRSSTRL